MSKYIRVLHGLLGPFERGSIIDAGRINPNEYDRLVAVGAIEDAPDADAEWSPGYLSFEETLRSGQFTMPNIPHTDVDPDLVRSKMGVPRETATVVTSSTARAGTEKSATHMGLGMSEPSPSGKSTLTPEVAEKLHAEEGV